MIRLRDVKQQIESDSQNWLIWLMDFVDDFRCHKDPAAVVEPFEFNNEKVYAVLASVAEYLCDELNIECPEMALKGPGLQGSLVYIRDGEFEGYCHCGKSPPFSNS
jgi:hypothetical protein